MAAGDADEHARFRRLFDDAYRPLLAYALRRTQNAADAEEIVADTLLIAWRRRDELPADAGIAWLYGVARKVIANQRRGDQRRSRLGRILAPLTRASRDADESVQLADATRAVLAASRRLPSADQEVLRLAAWEGSRTRRSRSPSAAARTPPPCACTARGSTCERSSRKKVALPDMNGSR